MSGKAWWNGFIEVNAVKSLELALETRYLCE
jgi:hypothetical protein